MLPSPSPTYKCFVSGSIVDWICIHQIRVLETQLPKYCVLKRIPTFWDPMIYSHQIPLSMGFLRQEYWSGLPFPSPGNLPDPGIEPKSLTLQTDSLPSEPPVKPIKVKWALKVEHWSNRFSVFMKRNTREFTLCLFVFSSISLPHPNFLGGVTEKPAWEGRVLTRTSPCWHPDLGLLAPRTVRKEISVVYSTESIVLFYGIPSW